ncbi:hypothetical protein [Spiroplasma floricola]|uniref:Uncharacterized protein n=1 Tax=Spiroplasma floricola 23-6 TaxID=1336749 RepID=A0A2K8SG36_9MOLU|nr:hypothetical protein [Spiroplasma floricola]AUB31780.1 hypothetical protein SFLOR_v1c07320 [Spiroplasma floricola 23-6]
MQSSNATLIENLKVANEFKYTNSGAYLSGEELEIFNNLVFKANLETDNWTKFFDLNSNKESYISFENSVSEFAKLWEDQSSNSQNINEYLKGIYSFGHFTLNNLQLVYKDNQPINLAPVVIPFTYKSQYTTVSSDKIGETSVSAKKYLTTLLEKFHNVTKIAKSTDSNWPDKALAYTSTVKDTYIWEELNLNFTNSRYNTFNYNDYNESLKKVVINNENDILKIQEYSSNSYVYKTNSNYLISDASTAKDVLVNLGYFKYKFSHKGALFFSKV